MSTEMPPPARIYRLMDSQAEAKVSIGEVIAHAKYELMIFDQSPTTLREREFGRPQNIDLMRALLLGSRKNRARRIRIALHEIQGIESEMPRLISLLGQFSDLLSIHRTTGAARIVQDVLLIADEDAIWRKPVATHPRSIVTLHDANETKPYIDRFEEIWLLSENAVSDRGAGL
ncbi:MAG: hypothetical protein WCL29_01830 [Pseudomonadota bacterium]